MSPALIRIETKAREISAAWGQIGQPRAKRFKGAQFRSNVLRFRKLVYVLEWSDFKEIEHFEVVEKLIQLMIAITEAWVVTQYDSRHTAECQAFGDIINDLRVALEGVRHGLPPNPQKRLTQEEIDNRSEAELFQILTPTA